MSDVAGVLVKAVVAALAVDEAVKALLGDPVRVFDVPPKGRLRPICWSGGASRCR
ncbi:MULTISPECIES: hypothetical protein [unclassified Brevundimonas]|uniref:hypothetical protein n=1 Tax=unclassified Brevundimonas TaxID=2622653 RepID=UPI0025B98FA4|nr:MULTISPECIES: hypothetical protein [unclassified Brevundimonas]